MIGNAIGPYQLIERLERPSRGTTYRALDPRLFGQPVTVTIFDIPDGDADFVPRFERSAESLIELRHPNILPLLDFGEAGGQVYTVTPYLEGQLLTPLLGKARRPVEALSVVATLAEALDHAHRLELADGAIEPGMIQLVNLPSNEETLYAAWPLLIEFGYATIAGAHEHDSPYRPPEGAENAAGADRYALAGLLHVLLTGAVPTPGGDPTALTALPGGLAAALRRALSTEPTERFASGADFVLALREAVDTDRRGDDETGAVLLEEARTAVTLGKFRAASDAYSAYLRIRPDDELARREYATVESRRAEIARRRAEEAEASAAMAAAALAQPLTRPSIPEAETTPDQGASEPTPATPEAVTAPGASAPVSAAPPPPPLPVAPQPGLLSRLGLGPRGNAPATEKSPARTPRRAAVLRDFRPIVSPARQRHRGLFPGALIAVMLVLILALGALFFSRRDQIGGVNDLPGDATPVPGSTITLPTIPAARSASPTTGRTGINTIPIVPTSPPIVPTPTPTLPPLPPVLVDQFDKPESGFPRTPGEQEGAGYVNGEYVLKVPTPDGYEIADLANHTFGDLVVEVDIWATGPTAGGSYGMAFHRQEVPGGFIQYFVLIDPEAGTFRLVRWTTGERVEVVPATAHPAIARGTARNRLILTIKGTTIAIQINGVEVWRNVDPGPTSGGIAFRADANTAPIEVHFDNLVIRPAR